MRLLGGTEGNPYLRIENSTVSVVRKFMESANCGRTPRAATTVYGITLRIACQFFNSRADHWFYVL